MDISKEDIQDIKYASQLEYDLDYAKELSLTNVDENMNEVKVPEHKCCDCVDSIRDMIIDPKKEYYGENYAKYAFNPEKEADK